MSTLNENEPQGHNAGEILAFLANMGTSHNGNDTVEFNAEQTRAAEKVGTAPASVSGNQMFMQFLLDHVREGVIIVNSDMRVRSWSKSAEVITGLSCTQMLGKEVTPGILSLADSDGHRIEDDRCPVRASMHRVERTIEEFRISGRSGREVKAEFTIVPVVDSDRVVHGALVLMYDTSIQKDLKQKLENLHAVSILDPLTGISNRAEFEKMLDKYVKSHHANNLPCSLIVCDIDYFKSINDNFGHHVGDQALTAFAQMLKSFMRSQDIVARYGGEEFVILCADCDLQSATERAEEIRSTLNHTPQQILDGKCLTASFGVTQLRDSDSPSDFFVRADEALLLAKSQGRNRVVQAQDKPVDMEASEPASTTGIQWRDLQGDIISSEEYITRTPMPLLAEKVSGYIREIRPYIVSIEPDHVAIQVEPDRSQESKKGRAVSGRYRAV